MALKVALIITGIAIGLLIAYGADVAVSMGNEAKEGFLPLNDMQRGIGLGVMIIIAGILIIIGGIAVVANPSPESADRDPVGSVVMLFAPAIIQLALGAIKIKKS